MYLTNVTQEGEVVATTVSDILSDAVDFANKVSSKDDKIIIYEVVQSASNLEVLGEVLKFKSEGSSFGGR
tara:strand:+ start:3628 stop:3837 length:210 start_codon:yes stop_codon:yes gene_type:complete